MLNRSTLFNRGFMTGQAGLAEVLLAHEQRTIGTIKQISSLDELTDSFLLRLIKESLIQAPSFDCDRKTRQLRTEEIDASLFPFNFNVYRGKTYPKQVARICIPFTGDSQLLKYTPSQASTTFPLGEVSGKSIQFDVILWEHEDDAKRVKDEVENNIRLLKMYEGNMTTQIKAFNEALPSIVKANFDRKLEQLIKQNSIFDDLGIEEEAPTPATFAGGTQAPQPKKGRQRATQIIQYIANIYVQELNQTNNNSGDVNNAIQSDQ